MRPSIEKILVVLALVVVMLIGTMAHEVWKLEQARNTSEPAWTPESSLQFLKRAKKLGLNFWESIELHPRDIEMRLELEKQIDVAALEYRIEQLKKAHEEIAKKHNALKPPDPKVCQHDIYRAPSGDLRCKKCWRYFTSFESEQDESDESEIVSVEEAEAEFFKAAAEDELRTAAEVEEMEDMPPLPTEEPVEMPEIGLRARVFLFNHAMSRPKTLSERAEGIWDAVCGIVEELVEYGPAGKPMYRTATYEEAETKLPDPDDYGYPPMPDWRDMEPVPVR